MGKRKHPKGKYKSRQRWASAETRARVALGLPAQPPRTSYWHWVPAGTPCQIRRAGDPAAKWQLHTTIADVEFDTEAADGAKHWRIEYAGWEMRVTRDWCRDGRGPKGAVLAHAPGLCPP